MAASPSPMSVNSALHTGGQLQQKQEESLIAATEQQSSHVTGVTNMEQSEGSRIAETGIVTSTDNMEMANEAIVVEEPAQPAMSKNAMKKAKRAERLAAVKLERRAREKEARKEKKRQRAEKRAAGELDDDEEERKQRAAKKPKLDFAGHVVVDLGFDELMSEKEVTSLCSQLAYSYSCNRQASYPFSLIHTALNGKTYQRLESLSNASYKRWSHTKWLSEGYDSLWQSLPDSPDLSVPGVSPVESGPPNATASGLSSEQSTAGPASTSTSQSTLKPQGLPDLHPKSNFVYLTADTEEELTELLPNEIYIIGGIVDHNRYKNLCLNKAKESGIRTARLPIGRYLSSLPTRKVLTVNQVFEILVKWVETKDWEEALYCIIPKRKFQQGPKEGADSVVGTADEECVFGEEVAPEQLMA